VRPSREPDRFCSTNLGFYQVIQLLHQLWKLDLSLNPTPHPETGVRRCIQVKSYQHEREANEFAAHFLLPETLVHQCWSDEPWADVLARRFKVSIDAMIRRLLELGLPIRISSDREEPAHLALIGKDWPPDLPDLFLEYFPMTTLNDKKTCPNCKSVAKRKEALFFWNCGTPLTNRCDRCNTILDSEDRYCELCGEPSYYHRNHLGIVTI
jgi:RNA polymerase subunit RPABC4/transcription elongation factor Spt4